MIEIPEHKQLILFDGVCNLCNQSVQIVIRNDRKNTFLFAPLQGKTGQELVSQYQIDTKKVDSILLYIPQKGLFYKSTAALKIASKLNFPWTLLQAFLIVPRFIRNWVYDFIANHRYKWFGRRDSCMVPTEALKQKFLD